MRLLLTPVELTLPADGRLLRLARLVATGVAAACGMPLENVEDFRIVVDEMCSTLVEASDSGSLALSFWIDEGELVAEGSTSTDPRRELDQARLALSHVLLDALSDAHQLVLDDDRITIVATTTLRAHGVG